MIYDIGYDFLVENTKARYEKVENKRILKSKNKVFKRSKKTK